VSNKRELPVWRSLLSVPVIVDKFVDRAHARGADVVQLDLENSVPMAEKERARSLVEKAAAKVRRGGADVVVRINRPLPLAVRDLEHSVMPDVDVIACSRIDSASHLRLLAEVVSELEEKRGMRVGHTRFIAMIETPEAFVRIDEIPTVERVIGMHLAGETFALNCDMQAEVDVLMHPKQRMIIAARAGGVMPIGFLASTVSFGDLPAFREMARRSKRFGFDAASCIHPDQIPIINEEYTPQAEALAYARKIIELSEQAVAAGRGSFSLEGKMVSLQMVERAEKLLKRSASIQARETRTLAAMRG
jgi:citrate lyase subunit beta / citryl-CoA lyase